MRLILGLSVLVLLSGNFPCGSAFSPTDSLGRINKIFTKLPLLLFLFSSEVNSAGVWIPEEPAKELDGSVHDEYAEVATVFAKPEAKVVKEEEVISEQPSPFTSLKQEWALYNKYHKKKDSANDDESSEDSEEEEEDEKKLPQAFYGQQNSDDDEKDHAMSEIIKNGKKPKKTTSSEDSEEEDEEDEGGPPPQSDVPSELDDIPDDVKKAMLQELLESKIDQGGPGPAPPRGEEEYEEEDEQSDESSGESVSKNKNAKGEEEEDLQDDHGKKGKKKKGKKGKKGQGQGWGWKPKLQYVTIPDPNAGWGWKDHDGLLEQLVKGSTWERVLEFYHQTMDDRKHKQKQKGWGEEEKTDYSTKIHKTGEKLVDKFFKGSFWDRAFQTYVQYKKENTGKPTKEISEFPLKIDW